MARKTALKTAPKSKPGNNPDSQNVPTRAGNKAIYDTMSPEEQAKYRKIRAEKGGRTALNFLNRFKPTTPAAPTPASTTEAGFMGAGEAYQDMVKRFQGEQYQPNFEQEMERSRQNVMQQFDRRNAEEFGRQQVDVQRQIAERGLDPNSEAAQGLYKQLNQRQDMARQEAMSAAEQAAYGVQQQQFTQADTLAMRPYEQLGALLPPYMAGVGAQYQNQQLQQQQGWEAKQAELERQNRLQIARMSQGGGGGPQGPNLYERLQAEQLSRGYNQQPQQNPWANVGQGIVTGATQGVTNWAVR